MECALRRNFLVAGLVLAVASARIGGGGGGSRGGGTEHGGLAEELLE